jgi:FKBP-type peptidyl-prolyl cis-trans isomerase 2
MKRYVLSLAVVLFLFCNINQAMGRKIVIEDGKTVKFHYTLTVKGEVADTSQGKEPLEYVQGKQMIIPGLESQLAGMKAGDKKRIVVGPEDAYGPIDPKAFVEMPKTNLEPGLDAQPGMVLQIPTKSGQPLTGMITEIKDETFILNFNHPLAGQELTFEVDIVDVK